MSGINERDLSDNKIVRTFQEFFAHTTAGGIVLIIATVVAMVWANSAWHDAYHDLWHTSVLIQVSDVHLFDYTMHEVINDGLMVIFFFLVGLEIKREVLVGELSSIKNALLPIMGAIGGVVFPALIYTMFNAGTEAGKGWAIPMATDIAFSLGVLSLVGSRVPIGLKVFLAALAIVDDLMAVLVIAVFYTADLQLNFLLWGILFLVMLFMANKAKVNNPLVYLTIGIFLWWCFLQSGVHATIAGVISAFMIPATAVIDKREFMSRMSYDWKHFQKYDDEKDDTHVSAEQSETLRNMDIAIKKVLAPLYRLEIGLHYYVAFLILPIFALANSGIYLSNFQLTDLLHPITLGISVGLLVGKLIGVFSFSWLAVKLKWANLPDGVNWTQIFSVAFLCGIGFTMSLFVSGLTFTAGSENEVYSKIGILLGSIVAGTIGYILLKKGTKHLQETKH